MKKFLKFYMIESRGIKKKVKMLFMMLPTSIQKGVEHFYLN